MRVILIIVGAFLIVALVGWLYMETGWYNIAATQEHTGLTRQMLDTAVDRSVRRQAKTIQPPASLTDPDMLRVGFIHFDAMCVTCHGAPGVSRSEIGAGLYPPPPSLGPVSEEWSPPELYWITKNGLKFTGMPAFGKTHSDDELWAVVAFVLTLPDMEPVEYLSMRRELLVPIDTTITMPHDPATAPMRSPVPHHHDDSHFH